MKKNFSFTSKVGHYPSEKATWYFAGPPAVIGKEIRSLYGEKSRGFGSLPVEAKIGKTTWTTSIFWDRSAKSYILFLKASVRKVESIKLGDKINASIKITI